MKKLYTTIFFSLLCSAALFAQEVDRTVSTTSADDVTAATEDDTEADEATDEAESETADVDANSPANLRGMAVSKETEIYNLCGKMIATSTIGLTKGVYIIKQGNTSRKVVIR